MEKARPRWMHAVAAPAGRDRWIAGCFVADVGGGFWEAFGFFPGPGLRAVWRRVLYNESCIELYLANVSRRGS